ncbi:Molecular chaperone (Small heat shock protein) [Planctomycetales bacterium 10988]|nr:Molecular chaperone (Small heat shock protein) [Planctomycetales bacterium 10988]
MQATLEQKKTYTPHADIVERENDFVLYLDLPGAKSDSIDLQYHDETLTIEAAIEPRQADETKYFAREYGIGNYRRTFRIHETIDDEKIEARYEQGVLKLTLPKKQAQPKKIQVQVHHG